MRLKRLKIQNFRAIREIDVTFNTLVSVLIGPNAVGKTTVSEAIRLVKAILVPRTASETTQTLIQLGVMSPHFQQRIVPLALTNTPQTPLIIGCLFELTDGEIETLQQIFPQIAPNVAQSNAGLSFAPPNQVVAYLDSFQGRQVLFQAQRQVSDEFSALLTRRTLELKLSVDFTTNTFKGEHPIQQAFFAALERELDPAQTLFSYFPADRGYAIGGTAHPNRFCRYCPTVRVIQFPTSIKISTPEDHHI